MGFVKRIAIAVATLASSKTASAAGAGGIVVAAAAGMGLDWLPWAVGAMGSTVVYAYKKKPQEKRSIALADGVVSVFLGGVGGPASVELASNVFKAPYLSGMYITLLASGILASAWPWIAPKLWSGLVGMWDGFTKGVSTRQQSKGNE